jgi:hypothetical protein
MSVTMQLPTLLFRPLLSVISEDLEIERIRNNSVRCNEVLLARLYQDRVETYNQAAFCYVAWFKRIGHFNLPEGLLDFMRAYKVSESADPSLRRSLLDIAFVKGCNTWGEHSKHSNLITAACVGSEVQLNRAQIVDEQSKKWDYLHELAALLSRLGLLK